MLRKKLLSVIVLVSMLSAISGCGNTTDSDVDALPEETAVMTEAEVTEEITDAATEEIPTEEVTEAATTEEVAEITEMAAELETAAESVSGEAAAVPTNGELLHMINEAFGMMTDHTFAGDLQAAQDWDIVDADTTPEEYAEITPEFLISSAMRATGFVNGSHSLEEILAAAVERNIIPADDISVVDVHQAADLVEKCKHAWANQDMPNEIHVELCDGVINLTEEIPAEEIEISDGTIKIPSQYAKDIAVGTVYILPKEAGNGQGGAYKAQSVTEENGATVIVSVPAGIEEVYKSISSN